MDNLEREIKEETGLEPEGEPGLVSVQDILRNPSRHVVRLTYVGIAKGEVVLDLEENDLYKWYDPKELLELADVDIYFKELLNNKSSRSILLA
jgi:ADP-ribose pyrophosphatase YjhB (NUDIX family)